MSGQSKLATGFRFRPTQEELIIFYLRNWVSGKEIPYAGILVYDIYGGEEPWEMWIRWDVKEDAEDVYVLTKLKSKGGSRIDRTTGKSGGCWHGEDAGVNFRVEIEEGKSLVCLKKKYSYKNKSSSSESKQFRWAMNEYSCSSLSSEHVICRLRRKESVSVIKRRRESSSSGVVINSVMEENPEMVIPPGFGFYPTMEELLGYYLFIRVTKKEAPFGGNVIKECDLYGEEEPWQVWDRFAKGSSEDLYFFTKLKKQRPDGSRISRKVGVGGNGTWHGEDSGMRFEVKIKIGESKTRVLSGLRKRYNYWNEKSSHHGKWIMYEYSCQSLSKEVVLGVLRNNRSAGDADGRISERDRRRAIVVKGEPVEFKSSDSEPMKESFCSDATGDDLETSINDDDSVEILREQLKRGKDICAKVIRNNDDLRLKRAQMALIKKKFAQLEKSRSGGVVNTQKNEAEQTKEAVCDNAYDVETKREQMKKAIGSDEEADGVEGTAGNDLERMEEATCRDVDDVVESKGKQNKVICNDVDLESKKIDPERMKAGAVDSNETDDGSVDSDATEDGEPRPRLRRFKYESLPQNWLSLDSGIGGERNESCVPYKKRHKFYSMKRDSN